MVLFSVLRQSIKIFQPSVMERLTTCNGVSSARLLHYSVRQASSAPSTPTEKEIEQLFGEESDEPASYDEEESVGQDRAQGENAPRRRYIGNGINRVELLGGVAGDPIVTVARNGSPYANFRMFTNVPLLKRNGQWTELVEVHNVSAFGSVCNYVKSNVSRGTRVYVSGRLHYLGGVDKTEGREGRRSARIAFVKADLVQAIASAKRNFPSQSGGGQDDAGGSQNK